MEKITLILKEAVTLVRKHKMYFLLPLLIMLGLMALLALKLGPGVVVSFVYAGL